MWVGELESQLTNKVLEHLWLTTISKKKMKRNNVELVIWKVCSHYFMGPSEAVSIYHVLVQPSEGKYSANIFFILWQKFPPRWSPSLHPNSSSLTLGPLYETPHFHPLPTLPLYKNKDWKKNSSMPFKGWEPPLPNSEHYRSGIREP